MEIQGKIIAALPMKSGISQKTGNQWMSAEYVIETHDQYPKKCAFTVFGQDRINQFNIKMGDELTVMLDVDAHEYNQRWFNELRAYNVVRNQGAQQVAQPTPQPAPQPVQQQVQQAQGQQQGGDGLPF